MTPEVRLIFQLSHRSIFDSPFRTESDVKGWVAGKNYYLDATLAAKNPSSASHVSDSFDLRIWDMDHLYSSLRNECNRFSSAAIESIVSIKSVSELPKSSAWSVIKMYYASFFAAHAILRLFGRGCVSFDSIHLSKVHEVAVVTGMNGSVASIEKGFYFFQIDSGARKVLFRKLKDTHADTWSSFHDFLDYLVREIPANTTGLSNQKIDAMNLVLKIKAYLAADGYGRGNWLSQLRNRVNYQQTHGVWFPYSNPAFDSALIHRNMNWLNPPQSFDGDLTKSNIEMMANASNCIVSFLYHLLKYGYDRTTGKPAAFQNGAFKLVNLISAGAT